jgi:UDP-glucose 4-epimerase
MSDKKASSVLVTGGAGFIGSHVVYGLVAQGYAVRVVDDLSAGSLANIGKHIHRGPMEFVKADIRDRAIIKKLVDGVDAVIHLAAIVSVPFSLKNPDLTYDVNVNGTRSLVESCVQNGVKRFIFVSSCAVYGSSLYLPIDEGHPTNPISPYAFSKLDAERCLEEFSRRSDFRTVILRLFNVYGPRQVLGDYSGVITKFIECVNDSRPLVIYGDGSQTRDFVYVTDVVSAMLTLLESREVDGVFNIGCGRAVSIRDLAKTVLNLLGSDCEITYKPPREGDIMHSVADITKARNVFGYSPRFSLEEGLRELLLG